MGTSLARHRSRSCLPCAGSASGFTGQNFLDLELLGHGPLVLRGRVVRAAAVAACHLDEIAHRSSLQSSEGAQKALRPEEGTSQVPGLPEVEFARVLAGALEGAHAGASVRDARVVSGGPAGRRELEGLVGARCSAVERRGKRLRLPCGAPGSGRRAMPLLHLGMSGRWNVAGPSATPRSYERVRLEVARSGRRRARSPTWTRGCSDGSWWRARTSGPGAS